MPTVLVMIVKDEAPVIRRCLDSVRPFVDAWVIADTGSTDGTPRIVDQAMAGLPGVIADQEWHDFATNRNAVRELARTVTQDWQHLVRDDDWYALTIDADEVLHMGDMPFVPPLLLGDGLDGYTVDVEYAGTQYRRLALTRLDRHWEWRGPVHEYLHLDGASIGHLPAPTIEVFHEGARSRDPDTYRKDAALLEAALEQDPSDTRNRFYLAQSYRDAGDLPSALREYQRRAQMHDGYADERWFSLYQVARIREWMGEPTGQVCWALLEAFNADPRRAEPLVELARIERLRERFAVAAMYAREAIRLPMPADGLFVERAAYEWRPFDELAISAYWSGDRDGARYAADVAYRMNPDDPRLAENLRMCSE